MKYIIYIIYILPKENHFISKDTHRLKLREWKKVFYSNRNEKKAREVILRQN